MNKLEEYREMDSALTEVASMLDRHRLFVDLFRHNWNKLEAFKNYLGHTYVLDIVETTRSDTVSFPTFKILKNYLEKNIVIVQYTQITLYEVDNAGNKTIFDQLDIYSLEDPQRIITWFQKLLGVYTYDTMTIVEKDMDPYEMIRTFLSYDIYSLCRLDAILKRIRDKVLVYAAMEGI